jgi:hypothetical protein
MAEDKEQEEESSDGAAAAAAGGGGGVSGGVSLPWVADAEQREQLCQQLLQLVSQHGPSWAKIATRMKLTHYQVGGLWCVSVGRVGAEHWQGLYCLIRLADAIAAEQAVVIAYVRCLSHILDGVGDSRLILLLLILLLLLLLPPGQGPLPRPLQCSRQAGRSLVCSRRLTAAEGCSTAWPTLELAAAVAVCAWAYWAADEGQVHVCTGPWAGPYRHDCRGKDRTAMKAVRWCVLGQGGGGACWGAPGAGFGWQTAEGDMDERGRTGVQMMDRFMSVLDPGLDRMNAEVRSVLP